MTRVRGPGALVTGSASRSSEQSHVRTTQQHESSRSHCRAQSGLRTSPTFTGGETQAGPEVGQGREGPPPLGTVALVQPH